MLRPLIFETDEQGYVIDERVKWFPVFKKLTQEEMTYVAWVTDYNSIYFNQPINLRRQRTSEKIQRERRHTQTHENATKHSVSEGQTR